jgi:hypothetical protein
LENLENHYGVLLAGLLCVVATIGSNIWGALSSEKGRRTGPLIALSKLFPFVFLMVLSISWARYSPIDIFHKHTRLFMFSTHTTPSASPTLPSAHISRCRMSHILIPIARLVVWCGALRVPSALLSDWRCVCGTGDEADAGAPVEAQLSHCSRVDAPAAVGRPQRHQPRLCWGRQIAAAAVGCR